MKVGEAFNLMETKMGPQPWLEDWRESPWEIVFGGVLVQNTTWRNVEPSLNNLKERTGFDPNKLLQLTTIELQNLVRPSGFYTRKAQTLRNVSEWAAGHHFSVAEIKSSNQAKIRSELLNLSGIGPETADYVLMYAFDMPGFIADKYSRRIFEWMGIAVGTKYDDIKTSVESSVYLSENEWKEFHALIVNAGKQWKEVQDFQEFMGIE
ncbi:endonuclease III domain-containing protein [Pediococcus claussenii]|nr:DNA-3-methyladenine glycosylase [Pediococcus claussenii]ANZ69490.1 DNA-3-methyladenine glycosylase [Pediococcus claussenii]ANZ71309.1 DNA-3-methyladenine glycosylase [Pediococcus claussenii]